MSRRLARHLIGLPVLFLCACLSWRIDTGANLHDDKMREYAGKCVDSAHAAVLSSGAFVPGGLPVGSVAPPWCDEAAAALDDLMAANREAQAARGSHGTAPQKGQLSAAIARVRKAFNGH